MLRIPGNLRVALTVCYCHKRLRSKAPAWHDFGTPRADCSWRIALTPGQSAIFPSLQSIELCVAVRMLSVFLTGEREAPQRPYSQATPRDLDPGEMEAPRRPYSRDPLRALDPGERGKLLGVLFLELPLLIWICSNGILIKSSSPPHLSILSFFSLENFACWRQGTSFELRA